MKLALTLLLLWAVTATAQEVKKDDHVIFVVRELGPTGKTSERHLLSNVYEIKGDTVRVAEYVGNDFFDDFRYYDVKTKDLILPLEDFEGIKAGSEICLTNPIRYRGKNYPKGDCGKAVHVFADGNVEVLYPFLFGYRKWLGAHDFVAHRKDLRLENPRIETLNQIEGENSAPK